MTKEKNNKNYLKKERKKENNCTRIPVSPALFSKKRMRKKLKK